MEEARMLGPESARIAVRIGGSRYPALARDSQLVVEIPPPERRAKSEPKVVGWVHPLDDGTLAFVKLYRHRPLVIPWEGPQTTLRTCREFDRLCRLEDARVPCTEPLFWARGKSRRHGSVEVLATRLLKGALPLRQLIADRESVVDELAWGKLLDSIDAMHAAGIQHGGLSSKNILLDPEQHFYICDLAKSMRYASPILDTRMALFDLVHFCHGLGKLIGVERCQEILRRERGAELAARVMDRVAGYRRDNRVQHLALRAEFHLRNFWSWHGPRAIAARSLPKNRIRK